MHSDALRRVQVQSFLELFVAVSVADLVLELQHGRRQFLPVHAIRSAAQDVCSFSHSSCAKSLCCQNCAQLPGILATSQRRIFKTTFASSSPATPATQSGLRG